jgi:DNA polymerase
MSKWLKLLDVYEEIENDPHWEHLRRPGIVLVRGQGHETAETARVMVVGEAPGARENGAGRPFVGASGGVLDQLLGLAGLDRAEMFVTNVVKYRPEGNRTPNVREVLDAQETLRKEWMIIRPKLTIAVGATAHSALHPVGYMMSLSATPSEPYEYNRARGSYCVSVFHPAYGLRYRNMQGRMERQWERLGEWLREFLPEVL